MRAEIIWSASRPTVMEPSSTWATNSLIRLFPCSRVLESLNRPCSTIWSRRLVSVVCTSAAGPPGAASPWGLAIGILLLGDFRLQLRQLLRLAHGFKQGLVQLLVGLQRASQIVQACPQLQQLPQ